MKLSCIVLLSALALAAASPLPQNPPKPVEEPIKEHDILNKPADKPHVAGPPPASGINRRAEPTTVKAPSSEEKPATPKITRREAQDDKSTTLKEGLEHEVKPLPHTPATPVKPINKRQAHDDGKTTTTEKPQHEEEKPHTPKGSKRQAGQVPAHHDDQSQDSKPATPATPPKPINTRQVHDPTTVKVDAAADVLATTTTTHKGQRREADTPKPAGSFDHEATSTTVAGAPHKPAKRQVEHSEEQQVKPKPADHETKPAGEHDSNKPAPTPVKPAGNARREALDDNKPTTTVKAEHEAEVAVTPTHKGQRRQVPTGKPGLVDAETATAATHAIGKRQTHEQSEEVKKPADHEVRPAGGEHDNKPATPVAKPVITRRDTVTTVKPEHEAEVAATPTHKGQRREAQTSKPAGSIESEVATGTPRGKRQAEKPVAGGPILAEKPHSPPAVGAPHPGQQGPPAAAGENQSSFAHDGEDY